MDETAVLHQVAAHFQDRGYQVWYNPRGLGHIPFPTHQVAVAGHYPDLLAVDAAQRVVAVETKGNDGDLARGLGQALLYKEGAHASFLAAPRTRVTHVAGVAQSHGLGVIFVVADAVAQVRWPREGQAPSYLRDVQRELAILAARGDQSRRIGSPALSLNNPLHYLAPVLVMPESAPVAEVAAGLQAPEGWGLKETVINAPLEGARVLGLVAEEEGVLHLTDKGRLVQRMIHTVHPREMVPELRTLTRASGRGEPLIDRNPLLGGILRFLYLEDPDVQELRERLRAAGGRLTLRQLLLTLLKESPNIVLSLFCKQSGKERLLEHLRTGEEEAALAPDEWPHWLMARSSFQLKSQLIHVGILVRHKIWGQGRHDADLDQDIWELRS